MSRLHRALARELWRLRGQVAAAALVVACGIAAFLTMLGAYHALVTARADYYAHYRFADVFAHARRAPLAVAEEIRRIDGVAAVEPRIVADVTLTVPGLREPATGRLISLPEGHAPRLNDLHLVSGRLPASGSDTEVVASASFARANALATGARFGAVLNGRWRELVIVGLALSPEYVYELGPATLFPDNRRFGVLWMNQRALAGAFELQGAFNDVALALAHGAVAADVIAALDRLLAPYGGLAAYDRAEQPSYRFLDDELGEIRVNATYIPAIFLAVAAFLLYTLLARLVAMQRGQIALLKAFGFGNARIGAHFLEFALAVAALGLLLGVLLGAWLGRGLVDIYQEYFHFPALRFSLPPLALPWAALIAALAAAGGVLLAVWRAARLAPAEALRPQAPRGYRAGLLERSGLARLLGPAGRLVARNLVRRPWRAALSIVAIAAAVGTVLLGRFAFDAVDRLVAVHFDAAQRDDLTLLLRETGGAPARYALAQLPGVLRVEPFRAVPVRYVVAHRIRRGTLLGVSPDAGLRRLVDARRRPIALPPAGLVLTRKLAKILGARPGDTVDVEQLEGRRRRFALPLVALSDEPLGVSGYMDAAALDRLLGEDRGLSGAQLQVDAARAPELYATLERLPAVGGVAIRATMLASIRAAMDRSFILMTVILTAFAAVLVVGVVYNSARIALSERANELASLRVLGYGRLEVTRLLLGEQAVLVLAALPLGCGLGALACRLLLPVYDRETFRLPFALSAASFGFAVLVTLGAALLSGYLVARRVARLDLVATLKSRE
ncbi:MAG: ABC transporter permease [Steroidobacteraceae bacterium]